MPRGLTVRIGHGLIYGCNAAEALALVNGTAFEWKGASSTDRIQSSDLTVLQLASTAAKKVHTSLLGSHACIGGRAAKNFGTLLHVAAVRQSCDDLTVRGIPLSKVLGYIAAANDAQRHLTATLIGEAVELVERTLTGNGSHAGVDGVDVEKLVGGGPVVVISPVPDDGAETMDADAADETAVEVDSIASTDDFSSDDTSVSEDHGSDTYNGLDVLDEDENGVTRGRAA